jgi:hypothetical protein
MEASFDTADLSAIAGVFAEAAAQAGDLCGKFAAGAGAPTSAAVIGGAQAAAGYAQALESCTRSLAQLTASLSVMGQKVAAAAAYYGATESANTVSGAR